VQPGVLCYVTPSLSRSQRLSLGTTLPIDHPASFQQIIATRT
jgi:hypothetical protein